MFFKMCQATGGTLLFDLDVYRDLTPAARRLFLKLKDRFWRSKRVFLNVDDLMRSRMIACHRTGSTPMRKIVSAINGLQNDRRRRRMKNSCGRNIKWSGTRRSKLISPHQKDGCTTRTIFQRSWSSIALSSRIVSMQPFKKRRMEKLSGNIFSFLTSVSGCWSRKSLLDLSHRYW